MVMHVVYALDEDGELTGDAQYSGSDTGAQSFMAGSNSLMSLPADDPRVTAWEITRNAALAEVFK